jgi:hypothetical protein
MESKVYGNTTMNAQILDELKNPLNYPEPDFMNILKIKFDNFKAQEIPGVNETKPAAGSLKKIYDNKESVINPAKIKADFFKNKVARVNENSIATENIVEVKPSYKANVETNVFSFNLKKLKLKADELEKGKLSDKKVNSAGKTSKIETALEQINNLINKGKNGSNGFRPLNTKIANLLTIGDFTLENNKLLTKENYTTVKDIINKIVVGKVNKLNNDELIKVMQFCNLIALNSEKLGLKKHDFQSIGTMVKRLISARKMVKSKRDEYVKLVISSEKNLENLVKIISDSKLKIGPELVKMLSAIIDGYSSWTNKVNIYDLNNVSDNDVVLKSVTNFRASVKNLDTGEKKIKEAEVKLKLLNLKLVKIILSDSFTSSWNQLGQEPDLIEDVLEEIINDIIANADRLFAEMDLSVEAGMADMVQLLQDFRKIITQLDLDLRINNKKQKDKHSIDEQYLKAVQDNKIIQGKLDESRVESLQEIARLNGKQISSNIFDLNFK